MKKESYRALKMFKALSNVVRYNIIQLLNFKEMDVGELSHTLNKTQANVSQHLKILKDLDIVGYYTKAHNVVYYLSNKNIMGFIEVAEKFYIRNQAEKEENI